MIIWKFFPPLEKAFATFTLTWMAVNCAIASFPMHAEVIALLSCSSKHDEIILQQNDRREKFTSPVILSIFNFKKPDCFHYLKPNCPHTKEHMSWNNKAGYTIGTFKTHTSLYNSTGMGPVPGKIIFWKFCISSWIVRKGLKRPALHLRIHQVFKEGKLPRGGKNALKSAQLPNLGFLSFPVTSSLLLTKCFVCKHKRSRKSVFPPWSSKERFPPPKASRREDRC